MTEYAPLYSKKLLIRPCLPSAKVVKSLMILALSFEESVIYHLCRRSFPRSKFQGDCKGSIYKIGIIEVDTIQLLYLVAIQAKNN